MSADGELVLNPQYLETVASHIASYCEQELDVIERYERAIIAQEEDWIDENFDENVLEVVQGMKRKIEDVLNQVTTHYPDFYKKRAQEIINRPRFRGKGASSGGATTGGPGEKKKDLKSSIDEIFANTNKDIRQKIFMYLMRIRFVQLINGRTSFYDPNGKSKRFIYKNIMALDINSPNFENDLLKLTGQHIYFYLQRKQQLQLIDSFNNELQTNKMYHDQGFTKYVDSIKSGHGLDFTYIDVKDSDYKAAMTFFSHSFRDYIKGASEAESNSKKYFSHTYKRFVEILSNLDS